MQKTNQYEITFQNYGDDGYSTSSCTPHENINFSNIEFTPTQMHRNFNTKTFLRLYFGSDNKTTEKRETSETKLNFRLYVIVRIHTACCRKIWNNVKRRLKEVKFTPPSVVVNPDLLRR